MILLYAEEYHGPARPDSRLKSWPLGESELGSGQVSSTQDDSALLSEWVDISGLISIQPDQFGPGRFGDDGPDLCGERQEK